MPDREGIKIFSALIALAVLGLTANLSSGLWSNQHKMLEPQFATIWTEFEDVCRNSGNVEAIKIRRDKLRSEHPMNPVIALLHGLGQEMNSKWYCSVGSRNPWRAFPL